MRVRLLEPARDELLGAVTFYEREAPGLGAEFLQDVDHAFETIASSPEVGTPFEAGTRRLLLRRFPYSVVYLFENDPLLVIAVAHQRRRPGYWKTRFP